MAQFLHIPLALGLSKGGLTLTAQLYDLAGVAVGSPITTGFVDHGSGAYSWYYAAYSDALAAAGGSVKFTGTGINVSTSFNPADFGLTNALSATAIATAVWASGTRTLTSFGTLVADTATAVWAAGTRTLTSFGTLVADTAAAVWAAGTRTLTSFGTLVADVTAAVWAAGTRTLTAALALGAGDLAAIAAAVWANATRTLTQTLASLVDAASGNTISRRRGDLWTISVTGLGNISTRTKLWFTIKESDNDPDTASILQIVEGVGLVYLNGAAGTAGHGSVVVTDAATGALTITVQEDATAALELASNLYYDIQILTAAGTTTPVDGVFKVTRDATRSIS